ncbi:putative diphthamide synthesis protein-domain-containing protein [Xylariaceae sp. FL0016]|nr:putative diphthamide synthesis protein-domain-containing protein [Xylariaceae sp. FL0016]
MASDLSAAPILSTPAEHTFFEDPTPPCAIEAKRPQRSDDELTEVYEISRTAAEIQEKGWKHIALQFPDAMLPDAPWVVGALSRELEKLESSMTGDGQEVDGKSTGEQTQRQRLYILADTSYSSCCVDEIAAEHANADGVVHYGRACLSPTSRLSVVHVFTKQKLDYNAVADAFTKEFADKAEKVVIMADVMFQEHVAPVCNFLKEKGYANVVASDIVRDPTGIIPNRQLIRSEPLSADELHGFHLFHISTPPTSLLLTLSSRLASLRIYPTPSSPHTTSTELPDPSATPAMLRRRYALVIRLATASIIGILVNTLSVKNYMSTISTLREQIAAAGKKSYTVVVGKLNAAKLANFAEMDGWVVVGCWESGLVDHEAMWKPVITPFELGLALQGDETRIWTGEWWGGIEGVKNVSEEATEAAASHVTEEAKEPEEPLEDVEGGVSDEESEAPVFDLRTGKLVSNSRPMRVPIRDSSSKKPSSGTGAGTDSSSSSSALTKKATGHIALVNGVASPGAEFLRSQRTWQGLGTDYNADDPEEEASTVVEEGRSGVARGYTVGDDQQRT